MALSLLADGMSVELTVTGHSMSPFIRSRDTLTLEPIASRRIHRGDIVAFTRAGDRLVVHRVIALAGSRLRTRGDSAARADEWIERREVVARVAAVTRRSRNVRLGQGRESSLIAGLSRLGLLTPLLRPLRWLATLFR